MATSIVKARDEPYCTETKQFKELTKEGEIKFRNVFLTDGVQQLAEVALIEQCAIAKGSFLPSSAVYSYRFETRYGTEGTFLPYFDLFKKRQETISKRCLQYLRHQVVHLDIKQYYPSVTKGRLLKKWREACRSSNLDELWAELGKHLIQMQFKKEAGMWVGSLFSHLLGNLFLRDLDQELAERYPRRYFRYVDDFVILVPPKEREAMIRDLKQRLKKLGLKLNQKKTLYVGAEEWRATAPFQNQPKNSTHAKDEDWMKLIDGTRRYLLANPEKAPQLREMFTRNEIRIPVSKHEAAIKNRQYLEKFEKRRKLISGLTLDTSRISTSDICAKALSLREKYFTDFWDAWNEFKDVDSLMKGWKKSRVRFLTWRCLLLGSEAQLVKILDAISSTQEFSNYQAMLVAVVERDVTTLMKLGWQPTFSVAHILASKNEPVTFSPDRWSQAVVESYTVLVLAGVKLEGSVPKHVARKVRCKFARAKVTSVDWAKQKDPFYQSLFCLSGGKEASDLQEALVTPLDPAENFEVFTTELMGLASR